MPSLQTKALVVTTYNPFTDIFLNSHHLCAWCCIEILLWSLVGVKGLKVGVIRSMSYGVFRKNNQKKFFFIHIFAYILI